MYTNSFPISLKIYNKYFVELGGNRDSESPVEFVSDYRVVDFICRN